MEEKRFGKGRNEEEGEKYRVKMIEKMVKDIKEKMGELDI